MATKELKQLSFGMDGDTYNISGFPNVRVTTIEQLNAIDYPCGIYGGIDIPDSGVTGADWTGIVMPSSGQITQIIDFSTAYMIARTNDTPPSGTWDVKFLNGGVTGVKGKQETNYRKGNINLTPDNISYLGTDVTGGKAKDTPALWKDLGTGYAYIGTANMVKGQPHTYGLIQSTIRGNLIFQLWHGTNNTFYKRYANSGSATVMPDWVEVTDGLAPLASPTFTGTPKAPTNTTYTTSTTQIATTAFVQGAINRRLPKTPVSKTIDSFSIASATYVYKNLYTAPADGILLISGEAAYSSNTAGYRLLGLQKEGSWMTRSTNSPINGTTYVNVSRVINCAEGDVIRAAYWQGSGSSLTVATHVWTGYFIKD